MVAAQCSGSCGESARIVAPKEWNSAKYSSRAASSSLQYAHQTPRKNVRTSGPAANRSRERTVAPRESVSSHSGAASPIFRARFNMPELRKSSVARCITAKSSGGKRSFAPARRASSFSRRITQSPLSQFEPFKRIFANFSTCSEFVPSTITEVIGRRQIVLSDRLRRKPYLAPHKLPD
jgi:hypothetical protein